jgi:acetyltransferase
MHLVRCREAREALMEAPASLPPDFEWNVDQARSAIAKTVAEERKWLDPLEINALLSAYRIPAAGVTLVRDPGEAHAVAQGLLKTSSQLVAKILSPDIVHKSDIGGVRLGLASAEAVRDAVGEILANARKAKPEARITGVTLHPMIVRAQARELIAGIADDPTFGPIIVFGRGGTAVEVINDKALALPPLDLSIARNLVARTRVSRILGAYRDVPAADRDAVALVLVKITQMAADLPEIREMDLNPLLADAQGVIVLDARVAVRAFMPADERAHGTRLAIRPYPSEWERNATLPNGAPIFIRPIRPEDEDLVRTFFTKVTSNDLRLRFFAPVKQVSHPFIARLTQLDYSRAIAFVALAKTSGDMLGAVRLHADADHESGEFAILVRSDLRGRGLGWILMQLMLDYARADGLHAVTGQTLRENRTMLKMCRELGFAIESANGIGGTVLVRMSLAPIVPCSA